MCDGGKGKQIQREKRGRRGNNTKGVYQSHKEIYYFISLLKIIYMCV